ncbi:MAG: hypothetical protein KGL92_04345 [Gammaproteobacteria bacterium]|nr:hypothetical protein [Gammaproteobacteria bacterium]MDE2347715.1 hypothetical protein [Gammaproteobacteria bacterium]
MRLPVTTTSFKVVLAEGAAAGAGADWASAVGAAGAGELAATKAVVAFVAAAAPNAVIKPAAVNIARFICNLRFDPLCGPCAAQASSERLVPRAAADKFHRLNIRFPPLKT